VTTAESVETLHHLVNGGSITPWRASSFILEVALLQKLEREKRDS